MFNWDKYALACRPDRWVVCGVRLKPLCIGHLLLLQSLGSPFVTRPQNDRDGVSYADLSLALFVCSRSYTEAEKAIGGRMGVVWGCYHAAASLYFLLRPWEFLAKAALFKLYLMDIGSSPSTFRPKGAAGRPRGTPSLLALKLRLMTELHYTSEQALSIPIGRSYWEIVGLDEGRGLTEVINEMESAAIGGTTP